MSDTLTYQQMGTAARGQAHALFAQTMGYVAVTAGLFALGPGLAATWTHWEPSGKPSVADTWL